MVVVIDISLFEGQGLLGQYNITFLSVSQPFGLQVLFKDSSVKLLFQ
jgi:hypothetical protein